MADNEFKKRGVDYHVQQKMETLSPEYYHSKEIYQEEIEKIFYKKWIFICREEEIAQTGDYQTVEIGDESLIITKDENDEIHALFNVCRHRGTRMCEKDHGSFESGDIVCPYHAWRYNLDGTLKAAPLMNKLDDFDKSDYPLFKAHVKVWGGFIFVNLDENPVPFEEELRPLIGKFEDWKLADLRIGHMIHYELKTNWKLIIQNYQECYHCPGVHPLLSKYTPFRNAVHDCMEGAVIGGFMTMNDETKGMTMDGDVAGPPICDVSGDDLKRVHYYSIFPNLLLSPHPDFVMYHRIRSVAIDHIINDCYFLLHPDTIADSNKMERFQSAIEFWDLTNRQDWQVCEQMMQGLKSKRFKKGRYADQEDILYYIDREVLKALGRIEEKE
jgi:Rieske 2Fe-2S family protein